MARPAFLQFLKHGKLLCRANFGAFVQTWNYLVRRCDSLRGEVEADGDGYTYLDNTDPENPVIRFRADKLPKGGGSGGVDGGCFAIKDGAFVNCHAMVGNVLHLDVASGSVSSYRGLCVALKVEFHYGTGNVSFSLRGYLSAAGMVQEMNDPDFAVIPLYQFDSAGNVTCDFRNAPRAQAAETLADVEEAEEPEPESEDEEEAEE